MYKIKKSILATLALVFTLVISCKDLDELNINPNGVDPANADLNFLLPTTETSLGQTVYGLGFGTFSGVMQHTQQTGWQGGYNNYEWDDLAHSWGGYYGMLMNNDEYFKKAVNDIDWFVQLWYGTTTLEVFSTSNQSVDFISRQVFYTNKVF